MRIETARGVYAQVNDGIEVRVSSKGTTLIAEVSKSELLGFAAMLLDVADDCCQKAGDDTVLRKFLQDALDSMPPVT